MIPSAAESYSNPLSYFNFLISGFERVNELRGEEMPTKNKYIQSALGGAKMNKPESKI
jgi:hypothetical protein